MSRQIAPDADIKSLMDVLAGNDGMRRQEARKSLVTIGKPAVPSLIKALRGSKLDQVRWEAVKALGEIRDNRSITPLVKTLEDDDQDVAWLAAEALGNFKKTAWAPVLHTLVKDGANSVLLRNAVHHVFLNQRDEEFDDLLTNLMTELDSNTVPQSAIAAAYEILKRLEILP